MEEEILYNTTSPLIANGALSGFHSSPNESLRWSEDDTRKHNISSRTWPSDDAAPQKWTDHTSEHPNYVVKPKYDVKRDPLGFFNRRRFTDCEYDPKLFRELEKYRLVFSPHHYEEPVSPKTVPQQDAQGLPDPEPLNISDQQTQLYHPPFANHRHCHTDTCLEAYGPLYRPSLQNRHSTLMSYAELARRASNICRKRERERERKPEVEREYIDSQGEITFPSGEREIGLVPLVPDPLAGLRRPVSAPPTPESWDRDHWTHLQATGAANFHANLRREVELWGEDPANKEDYLRWDAMEAFKRC